VRLLNEIASWIASSCARGVAGIGKSMIAKTVAERAAGIKALCASFFFSCNDDKQKTAKTFPPTIAYQLAHYNKDFADEIDNHSVTLML